MSPTPHQLFSQALSLHSAGDLPRAIELYRQVLSLNPAFIEAHNNLGTALRDAGQFPAAITSLRTALALRPNSPDILSNLASALKDNGQLDQAITAFQSAQQLAPADPIISYNLGIALYQQPNLPAAIASLRRALELNPNFLEAHTALGTALQDAGQLPQAIASFRTALTLQPTNQAALYNLANALYLTGDLDQAASLYQKVLTLNPNFAPAHNNLANTFKDQGLLPQAIASYRQAISLNPTSDAGSNLLYALHFSSDLDNQTLDAEHRAWNHRIAAPLAPLIHPHTNNRDPNRPLRIGYVSPDFRSHPVGRFLIPLFQHHDHQNFHITCYSDVQKPDSLTHFFQQKSDQWRPILHLSHDQAVSLVRNDQIDILVDLTLHMQRNRLPLFARKPAPLQITYLAYCSSSGMPQIDYRFTDPYLDPPDLPTWYTEKSLYLPSYWCYPPPTEALPITPPPSLTAGTITFGCLNNFFKISPATLETWSQILRQLPHSRLLLHALPGVHRQRVENFLASKNLPNRCIFASLLPLPQYFQLYQQIDIALDTFPYAGGTTSCDALWMGIPLITLAPDPSSPASRPVSRGGVSILSQLNLQNLIAHSPHDYITLATTLAQNPSRLINLRSTLRNHMLTSPLMNAPLFTHQLESHYRTIWQTHPHPPTPA